MASMFRKKHVVAGFGMLLFFCTLWMLHQQDEITHEISTSSDEDMQLVNILYPMGEIQYRKEQQRIILEQMEEYTFAMPVETRHGNYKEENNSSVETTKVLSSKKDGLNNKQDGRRLSKKANKKVKLQEKRVRGQNESIEIPELSALEMEEFQTRIHEYCNPPSEPLYGVEGQVSERYKLHYVHVIGRHGDRTPITQLDLPDIVMDRHFNCDLEMAKRDFPTGQLLSRFVASVVAQDEALGDRPQMPMFLRTLPIGSHARKCAIAQLTPIGWLQLMRLGEHMKKAYKGKLVAHPGYFRNPNITVFQSTMNSRTQQSVFAFMFGFLPRLELHFADRIKITDSVSFCFLGANCSCPATLYLEKAKQKQFGALHKDDTQVQQLLKSLAATLINEPKPKKVPGITAQQELYFALTCHKKSLPCSPYGCITAKHFANIISYTDRVSREVRSIEDGPYQKFARLNMHPLMTKIAMQMKKISHGSQNYPKFVYYSGHDITVSPLLDILGLGDFHWPRYAANVVFELWSKSESFYLRVLYNGQDRTNAVRFCRDDLNEDSLCPLRNFLKFVNRDNMGFFHVGSFEEACKLTF